MVANFSTIRQAIADIIAADTDLSGTGQVFQYEPEVNLVTVDPWACVVPLENQSEFETTIENMRTYNFAVRIFIERKGSRTAAQAETLLTAIVDRLVQAFDESWTLGVSGVLISKAAPSSWQYVLADKEYRMAEIKLSTSVSVDVAP